MERPCSMNKRNFVYPKEIKNEKKESSWDVVCLFVCKVWDVEHPRGDTCQTRFTTTHDPPPPSTNKYCKLCFRNTPKASILICNNNLFNFSLIINCEKKMGLSSLRVEKKKSKKHKIKIELKKSLKKVVNYLKSNSYMYSPLLSSGFSPRNPIFTTTGKAHSFHT